MRLSRKNLRKIIIEELSRSQYINEAIQVAGQEASSDDQGNVVIGDKKFSLHKTGATSWAAKAADAAGALGENGAKINILGLFQKDGVPFVKGKLGEREADIGLTNKMISIIKNNLDKSSFKIDGENIQIEFRKV
jgi:hypothetical protein